MQKYEYKYVSIVGTVSKINRILNEYASDGWELFFVVDTYHYFRREV